MKTIQMTLDEELVNRVDKVVKVLKTTRSAFTRDALNEAIKRIETDRLEEKHRRGYQLHPAEDTEFSIWEDEQEWGDE